MHNQKKASEPFVKTGNRERTEKIWRMITTTLAHDNHDSMHKTGYPCISFTQGNTIGYATVFSYTSSVAHACPYACGVGESWSEASIGAMASHCVSRFSSAGIHCTRPRSRRLQVA